MVHRALPGRTHGHDDGYTPEIAKTVKSLLSFGATMEELLRELDITSTTLNSWKWKYKELADSIKIGKAAADARVEQALYSRAIGFTLKETQVFVVSDGARDGAHLEEREVDKHYIGDVAAQKYWLNNRKKANWADKQTHELTGPGGGALQVAINIQPIAAGMFYDAEGKLQQDLESSN